MRRSIAAALALTALFISLPGQAADGRRYKVDGHRLYLACAGTGKPVVILDAGLGTDSTGWRSVQPQAARIGARVCAYDRLGLGRSTTSGRTRTLAAVASDLHALVRAAKLTPPFVLVGHSMGGLIDRYYAKLYPGDVSGLVLVDSVPDTFDRYVGIRVFAGGGESLEVDAASTSLRRSDTVGSKPVVVIQAETDDSILSVLRANEPRRNFDDFPSYWRAAQRKLARISSNSLSVVATGSDHGIPLTAPNLVRGSIRLVAASARSGRPLPACGASGLEAVGGACR